MLLQVGLGLLLQLMQDRDEGYIVRCIDDHLLTLDLPSLPFADQILQSIQIGIGIQDDRVIDCLVGQEHA